MEVVFGRAHSCMTSFLSESQWESMIARFRPSLLKLASPILATSLRGKADPEDVVQETLLVAHSQRNQFRGQTESELTAWLQRILASRLSHLFRRYQKTASRAVIVERELGHAEPIGRGTSPSQGAARAEVVNRVGKALARLPVEYRHVITWREQHGLEFFEIARLLGRSENAARKLWTRALQALQTQLDSTDVA